MSRFPAARPWAVLALLAAAACAPADAPAEAADAAPAMLTAADRAAIAQGTTSFEEHALAADFAAVASHYTPDAVVMPPNAPSVTGPAAIQAFFQTFPPLTAFDLTEVTVDGAGDIAFAHGTYTMTFTMPDGTSVTDNGKYVDIRRRQADGSWLITHDIFNSDMPLPTP